MSVLTRIRARWGMSEGSAPAGFAPATKLAARARRSARAAGDGAADGAALDVRVRELLGERERLTERFALLQTDLGGVFYEMAIRDHVRMDVLTARAAELQRVDQALAEVERQLREPSPFAPAPPNPFTPAPPRGAAPPPVNGAAPPAGGPPVNGAAPPA
ncbi:hypothetical protein Q5424_29095, partial [Conexibacter sp. JD483]